MQHEMSLFVYGSMSEGMVHYDKIAQYIVDCQPATIKGQAYRLQVGYPVVLKSDLLDLDEVSGQLVKLRAPDLVYKLLDEFHGFSVLFPEKSLFLKEKVEVTTAAGEVSVAEIYVMNPSKLPKTATRIPAGDWQKSFHATPPLTKTLSERQLAYVKRLSQVSGREIVPIDLELYRELMKLELVVDKGRRLALSKLGQEVARYL